MIRLRHSKRSSITKSFTIQIAEKELRKAIDKAKRGFKESSHWQLPVDSGYKLDNGKLIEVKKVKKSEDK